MAYKLQNSTRDTAEGLFDRMWFYGRVRWALAKITGQSRDLLFLSDLKRETVEIVQEPQRAIDIDKIKGTSGRADRFDVNWYPVQRRSRNRWVGVATAIMTNFAELPPIDVVQVGDVYYVTDGNHRVSAARALDKMFLEANVTRWVMDGKENESGI